MTTSMQDAEPILKQVETKYGFVPNILAEMACSPAALAVYVGGQEALGGGLLTDAEQHVVQLTVSAVNGCDYCTGAHSAILQGAGVSAADIEAIRSGALPEDAALAAVVRAARMLLDKKGWLEEADVRALADLGVTKAHLYEVIAFIGLKTLSNYVNHISHLELDPQFGGVS